MNLVKTINSIVLVLLIISLQSCGVLIFNEDKMALKKFRIQEEQYKPYKLQNTIEGYKEFIAKYPKNTFVSDAQSRIENLEFSPYEEADAIEGYMEFKMRYPRNRYIWKANTKIERVELKQCEEMDTIACYEEFLSKYPESTFAILAKERLQELELRALDSILQKQYGFDLLRYRLQLKRLKKELPTLSGVNLSDFICFASLVTHQEKKYFFTNLIYTSGLSHSNIASTADQILDTIVSKALLYLANNFMTKGEIEGFSFDVSVSAHNFYRERSVLVEYYFPLNQVKLFAANAINKNDLLAQSTVIYPTEETRIIPEGAPTETPKITALPLEVNGLSIMTMVSEREAGKDFIISRSLEMGRYTMKHIEKRINLRGKDGFIDKSIIRFIDPPNMYGAAMLIWNYEDREKALWFKMPHREATRQPPASFDSNSKDYTDIKVKDEKHQLLRSDEYQGKKCYVVESTPMKSDLSYGKRMSWIDPQEWIPLKIEYFDKEGKLWKVLHIEWQNKFGFWFWKKAVVENLQSSSKTFITTEDVRVNVGLQEREFTTYGLEQSKHGF